MAAMLEQLVLAAPPDALALHAACISPSLEDRVEMIRSLSSSVAMALMGEPADQHAERVLDDLAFVRHAWAPLCEWCLYMLETHVPGWQPNLHVDAHIVARFSCAYRIRFRSFVCGLLAEDIAAARNVDLLVSAPSVWYWLRPVEVPEAAELRRLLIYELTLQVPEPMATALLRASIGVVQSELDALRQRAAPRDVLALLEDEFHKRPFSSALALLASDEPACLTRAIMSHISLMLDAMPSPKHTWHADLSYLWGTLAVLSSVFFFVPATLPAVLRGLTDDLVGRLVSLEQRVRYSRWAVAHGAASDIGWLDADAAAQLLAAVASRLPLKDMTSILPAATQFSLRTMKQFPRVAAAMLDALSAQMLPRVVGGVSDAGADSDVDDALIKLLSRVLLGEFSKEPNDAEITLIMLPLAQWAAAQIDTERACALFVKVLALQSRSEDTLVSAAASLCALLVSGNTAFLDILAGTLPPFIASHASRGLCLRRIAAVAESDAMAPLIEGGGPATRALLKVIWRLWLIGDADTSQDNDGGDAALLAVTLQLLSVDPTDPFGADPRIPSVVAARLFSLFLSLDPFDAAADTVVRLLEMLCRHDNVFFRLIGQPLIDYILGPAQVVLPNEEVDDDVMVDVDEKSGRASSMSSRSSSSRSSRASLSERTSSSLLRAGSVNRGVQKRPSAPFEQNRDRRPLLHHIAQKSALVTAANASSELVAYVSSGTLGPLSSNISVSRAALQSTPDDLRPLVLLDLCCRAADGQPIPTRLLDLADYAAERILGASLASHPLQMYIESLTWPPTSERDHHVASLLESNGRMMDLIVLLSGGGLECLTTVLESILIHAIGAFGRMRAGTPAASDPRLLDATAVALRLLEQAEAVPERLARIGDVIEEMPCQVAAQLLSVPLVYMAMTVDTNVTRTYGDEVNDEAAMAKARERMRAIAVANVELLDVWFDYLIL